MAFSKACSALIVLGTLLPCLGHLTANKDSMYQTNYKHTDRLITETGPAELTLVAPLPPSAVLSCASMYTMRIANHLMIFDNTLIDPSIQLLAQATNEMIGILCGSDYYFGVSFISCIQLDLPQSPYFLDKMFLSAFNMTALPNILYGGCNVTAELNQSMECIINGVMSNPSSVECLTDIGVVVSNILNTTATLESALEEFCRVWGTMVTCISPYIGICNTQLASLWMLYGQQILTSKCHQHAFPIEESKTSVTDNMVHEVFSALNLTNSAVAVCANQYNKGVKQYLPTSIINPAAFSNTTLLGINSMCGTPMEEFLFCLDEKRLNLTSSIDNFMFKIISTSNMRRAYTELCSQIEVLKSNVNCLINSVMELQTCMCYMTELIPKVVELSAQPGPFSLDKIVDPFYYTILLSV